MRITHWRGDQVEARWADLKGLFERALEYAEGEMNLLDLYQFIQQGVYHVAVVDDGPEIVAVLCYRVVPKARLKILLMELAAGSRLDEWMDLNEAYAFDLLSRLGCDRLELVGRLGWSRALSKRYPNRVRTKCVTLILEAEDGRRRT